jgi:hypothetical protein
VPGTIQAADFQRLAIAAKVANRYRPRFVAQRNCHLSVSLLGLQAVTSQSRDAMLKSRTFRSLLASFILATAITYALAALAGYLIDNREWFITSIWILLAVWLAEFMIGLKRAVVTLLMHPLTKSARRDGAIDYFQEANMPPSFNKFDSADDYFQAVMADKTAPGKARLAAAATLAELQLLRRLKPLTGILTAINLDAALLKYSRQARRSQLRG